MRKYSEEMKTLKDIIGEQLFYKVFILDANNGFLKEQTKGIASKDLASEALKRIKKGSR